ncbi:hypothetical protein [Nonomuraea sp. NPDC005650]|uniref:hypothetical protein n=1 Tax=Nonomuraea sp. NPDC005650 TaxID=3157045 RepID=UPI0033AA1400
MSTAADSPWRPLRERLAGMTGERALVESVPEYMAWPLSKWLIRAIQHEEGPLDLATLVQLRLRRASGIGWDGNGRPYVMLQGDELLEAIDAALDIYSFLAATEVRSRTFEHQWWGRLLKELQSMLEHGGSAWKLNDDFNGLTRRVDETVSGAAQATMQAAPEDAASHLRRAWDATYGFNPDPTKAYSEAVKAVEAVVVPVTIPNDRVATLGKAIAHIKSTAAKWSIAIDQAGTPAPADALLAMLGLVWHGQSDRHAGPNTAPVTLESAQTALHAAVTLVQWFTSGAVKKSP